MKKLFFLFICFSVISKAQSNNDCALNPVIVGDTLICPNDVAVLNTQAFESYQWYVRAFGSSGVATAVPNATEQVYSRSADSLPVYVSVEVTQGNCTQRSEEVLIKAYNFSPIDYTLTGSFTLNVFNEVMLCAGNEFTITIKPPYAMNFVWFNDNEFVEGAFDNHLTIVQPGNYWVVASPAECPNWADVLSEPIHVIQAAPSFCATAITEPELIEAEVFPNPAADVSHLRINNTGYVFAKLLDSTGKLIEAKHFQNYTEFNLSKLNRGFYFMQIEQNGTFKTIKITVI